MACQRVVKGSIYLLSYSFREYLLSTFSMPWVVLRTRGTVINKTHNVSAVKQLPFSSGLRYGWSSCLQMVLSICIRKLHFQKWKCRSRLGLANFTVEARPLGYSLGPECLLQIYWGLTCQVRPAAFFFLFANELCNLFSKLRTLESARRP